MLDFYLEKLNNILLEKNCQFLVFFNFDEYFSEIPAKERKYLYFLTGFDASNAIFIFSNEKSYYYTDGRYLPEATSFFRSFNIKNHKIEVLDIKENFLSLLKDKRVTFFEGNLSLKFFQKNKGDFEFSFLKKEEFLEIFSSKKDIFLKSGIKFWQIKYPIGVLEKRKTAVINFYKDFFSREKIEADCIFLHDIQFNSWLSGKRSNISLNCANEEVFLIFLKTEEVIGFEGNDEKILHSFKKKLSGKKIFFDDNISLFYYRIFQSFTPKENLIFKSFDVSKIQARKNDFEMKEMVKAHKFHAEVFSLFEETLSKINFDKENLTEFDLVENFEKLCKFSKNFISLSFDTIVGSDENSAKIHYRPQKDLAKKISNKSIILIDSGCQFKNGTTDMTRMIFLKNAKFSKIFKLYYTAVLKAHIQLALTKFLPTTTGQMLDFIARKEILKVDQDYNHGTGHGVGFCLNVHEKPSISPLSITVLEEGNVLSIEPGIYIENQFGIRIENLYYIFKEKDFLVFKPLTKVKINTKPVIFKMLTEEEKKWLEKYNKFSK